MTQLDPLTRQATLTTLRSMKTMWVQPSWQLVISWHHCMSHMRLFHTLRHSVTIWPSIQLCFVMQCWQSQHASCLAPCPASYTGPASNVKHAASLQHLMKGICCRAMADGDMLDILKSVAGDTDASEVDGSLNLTRDSTSIGKQDHRNLTRLLFSTAICH